MYDICVSMYVGTYVCMYIHMYASGPSCLYVYVVYVILAAIPSVLIALEAVCMYVLYIYIYVCMFCIYMVMYVCFVYIW